MSSDPYENLPPAASFSLTSSDLREGETCGLGGAKQASSPRLQVHGASGCASARLPPFSDEGGLALAQSASPVLRPLGSPSTVGIVANPASGRDIRRLVSQASVFPTAEKSNMVQRMLGALGALGVDRVLMMPEVTGICAAVDRARIKRSAGAPTRRSGADQVVGLGGQRIGADGRGQGRRGGQPRVHGRSAAAM